MGASIKFMDFSKEQVFGILEWNLDLIELIMQVSLQETGMDSQELDDVLKCLHHAFNVVLRDSVQYWHKLEDVH